MANPLGKKVIVRTLIHGIHAGYLPLTGFVQEGIVPLLDLAGRVVSLEAATIRHIAWVRDFNLDDPVDPERLARREFLARPRSEGLWVRLTLRGEAGRTGDRLEGLAALNLAFADGWMQDRGVSLIPPDIRSNTQRLFIPRSAMTGLQILAVITTPSKSKPVRPGRDQSGDLFPPG